MIGKATITICDGCGNAAICVLVSPRGSVRWQDPETCRICKVCCRMIIEEIDEKIKAGTIEP